MSESGSEWDMKKVIPFVLVIVVVLTVIATLIFGPGSSSNNTVSGNVIDSKPIHNYNVSNVQETSPSKNNDSIEKIKNSLSALSDSIKNSTRIYEELDNCTSLCAGSDIDIPAVKDQCYSSCYQIYYSGGEGALINFINSF